MNKASHLLILPHLRVQNANAISSPLTWGFPAMNAFVGFMHALERRLPDELLLEFHSVGVVCHSHEIQSSSAGYNLQQFHLTRNPVQDKKYVNKDGSIDVPAIVEEGRMHMDISLVFAVAGNNCAGAEEDRKALANRIDDIVHSMRIADGSVFGDGQGTRAHGPMLVSMPDDIEDYEQQFRKLRRHLLPGFALVLNEKALQDRFAELREHDAQATLLDAWLDFSRLHHDFRIDENTGESGWEIRSRAGWHVPIPVGYGALSELHAPGEVTNARDDTTPFRFVESLYSIGQWVSPHRLRRPEALLWYVDNDPGQGVYRLNNDYVAHR